MTRRDFIRRAALTGTGLAASATIARWLSNDSSAAEMGRSNAVRTGAARHITILHTTDIHAQLEVHDEFFIENGKPVFKRRGGFATLHTMIAALRRQNPDNTLLVDTGDFFHGSAAASLSRGAAMVPLVNRLAYDLMLPGNWEVMYGKDMLVRNLNAYSAAKVCTNMYHSDAATPTLLFPAYQVLVLSGVKLGFIGYNDPLTPTRQPPAFSAGIRFTRPEENLARYVTELREHERCDLIFVLAHLGLAQQIALSNDVRATGVHYILGGDTHERVREPLAGTYAKVTEPGAFGSFLGKLDLVVEDGKIKDESYALLDVDPELYAPDETMSTLVSAAYARYRTEADGVIGTTTTPLMRYYVLETPIDNLITDALMWKFGTDITVSNGFRFCPPLVPRAGAAAQITNGYLWAMLPIDSRIKRGIVSGREIRAWLETELESIFAEDASRRFGGWLVRYKGLSMKFTIGNAAGERIQELKVQGELLEADRHYSVVGTQRAGDPDDVINRLRVREAQVHEIGIHRVLREYLAANSPVSPVLEGRALATDAPADLLSQIDAPNYRFR